MGKLSDFAVMLAANFCGVVSLKKVCPCTLKKDVALKLKKSSTTKAVPLLRPLHLHGGSIPSQYMC